MVKYLYWTYRLYHEKFVSSQQGSCGITLNIHWAEPKQPNDIYDMDAVERYLQFNFGWFAHPILKDGKYPTIMRQKIDSKSKKQGNQAICLPIYFAVYSQH